MAHSDVPRSQNFETFEDNSFETKTSNIGPGCIKLGSKAVEKRKGELPVPLNLRKFLSKQQIVSARQMENFGWHIAFIRRTKTGLPIVVVANNSESRFGLLETDGSINTTSQLAIRH